MQTEQIIAELKELTAKDFVWNRAKGDFDVVDVKPTLVEHPGAVAAISAEDGGLFANYYSELSDDPWIHKKVEQFAARYNLTIEWVCPGYIALYA